MAMIRRIQFMNKGNRYQKRCHYCHRPANELYQARFSEGGPMYLLHPGNCFKAAMTNYKQNVENGTMPTISQPQEGLSEIQQTSIEGEQNIMEDGNE